MYTAAEVTRSDKLCTDRMHDAYGLGSLYIF